MLNLDVLSGENMSETSVLAERPVLPTFDLHKVEESLMTNHHLYNGVGWTREEMHTAVQEYREFLRDIKVNGQRFSYKSLPSCVDRVWHAHICETDQYESDVTSYLGYMLHHCNLICDGGVDD